MALIRLIAQDADDLAVLSAHCQDAIARVRDIDWRPARQRFVVALSRFDWLQAQTAQGARYERRLAGLRFDRVRQVASRAIDISRPDALLTLLALHFEPAEPPSGTVTLLFSGDGAMRLDVECIEAALIDLGPAWRARSMPSHGEAP